MNPCAVIVKTLRKDCLKKNALWEGDGSENSSRDEKQVFWICHWTNSEFWNPVQGAPNRSQEKGETTQNSLGALSENELCSASSINQGVSLSDVLPCSWIHSVLLLWKEISKPFGSMWSLRIRSRHLTKWQEANYMSNSSGSTGFRSNLEIILCLSLRKKAKEGLVLGIYSR